MVAGLCNQSSFSFNHFGNPPQPSEFVILVVRGYLDFVSYSPIQQILTGLPVFISYVLKRSDTLTTCKKHLQLDLRAGLPRSFYSVYRPWPSRSCFIGWARISGKGELLGGAFST